MNAPKPIRVCVVTTSRSDYGLMRWLIHDLASDSGFSLDLVVTGSHLSLRHGHTVDEIVADGHDIAHRIPVALDDEHPGSFGRALAAITAGLTDWLVAHQADLVLVLGDRWELLGIAAACTMTATPLGHFSGGEVTEGALDDNVRHATTKLSHLHFVANETYAARIRQLGEEPWRISVCGGPGIDNFTRLQLLNSSDLSQNLGIDLSRPTALVAFHPATRSAESVAIQTNALVAALRMARERLGLQFVITGPAVDPGADEITSQLRAFAQSDKAAVYVESLGTQRYLSLLKVVRVMIGNSSSAYSEAPVVGLRAVDIGDRQKGRLSGGNLLKVGHSADEIFAGIGRAMEGLPAGPFTCRYGDGSASPAARKFIKAVFAESDRRRLLQKRFVDAAHAGAA